AAARGKREPCRRYPYPHTGLAPNRWASVSAWSASGGLSASPSHHRPIRKPASACRTEPGGCMETLWRIEMLGGLRAVSAQQAITRFRSHKTGALLAYLAFYRERA